MLYTHYKGYFHISWTKFNLFKVPNYFQFFKLPNGMANLFRLPSVTYSFPGYCNAINAMHSNVVFH